LKVVLDTNVVLCGFFFGGVPGRLLKAWNTGRIEVILSASILAEYKEAAAVLETKYGGSEFVAPDHLDEAVSADPDDDKFLACARASGVRVIVSGDKHLLEVRGWEGIEVVKPRAFSDRYLADREGGA
jgi:predicted nucleic acid-binding protein